MEEDFQGTNSSGNNKSAFSINSINKNTLIIIICSLVCFLIGLLFGYIIGGNSSKPQPQSFSRPSINGPQKAPKRNTDKTQRSERPPIQQSEQRPAMQQSEEGPKQEYNSERRKKPAKWYQNRNGIEKIERKREARMRGNTPQPNGARTNAQNEGGSERPKLNS